MDRHCRWIYSLHYFNRHLRNMSVKYKASYIYNDPDYNSEHPLGYNPNRGMSRKMEMFWYLIIPGYYIEDPLYQSCLHVNLVKMSLC